MKLTKDEEEIYKNIKERLNVELYEALNCKVSTLKLSRMNEEIPEKLEMIRKYLKETTEQTRNKKDVIALNDLWNKYDDWNRTPQGGQEATAVDSVNEFGKYITYTQEYEKGRQKLQGKTAVVITNIKYKEGYQNPIRKFIEEYTTETEDSKDRIAVKKLLRLHNLLEYSPRIGIEDFKTKAKLGGYTIKTSYEKGKTKTNEVEACIMKRKGTEELKELFEKEGLE